MANCWKIAASLLILGHFAAIVSSMLGSPTPNQPAPMLAVGLNQIARPYLNALFLKNSFRFYAPNPGPARLMWYRLERADGTMDWGELPGRRPWGPRTAYQRQLSLSSFLDMQVGPDQNDPTQLALTPTGRICAAAFVRQLIRKHNQSDNCIRAVELFTVHHRVLEPHQIKEGWEPEDLRLYRVCSLGRFAPDGVAAPSDGPRCPSAVESSRLAARMCVDWARGTRPTSSRPIPAHWPHPLRVLVQQNPSLLVETADEQTVKVQIERLARGGAAAGLDGPTRTVR